MRNTFTQSYGSKELDAATLLIVRTGFLPPDDPGSSARSTRSATSWAATGWSAATAPRGLRRRAARRRGAFLACSFWLVDALQRIGRHDEARELFEHLLELRSDVGLLAEEYDVAAGRQLGNFPRRSAISDW